VQGRLLLDVVVGQGTSIFKLLSSEDQSLLVWRNSLPGGSVRCRGYSRVDSLVLDLRLDIVNGVGALDLKGDGLSSEAKISIDFAAAGAYSRLDKDLHTTSQTQNQVKGRLLLDVVVRKGTAVFELFTGKDQSLLVWGNTLPED